MFLDIDILLQVSRYTNTARPTIKEPLPDARKSERGNYSWHDSMMLKRDARRSSYTLYSILLLLLSGIYTINNAWPLHPGYIIVLLCCIRTPHIR